MSNDLFSPEVKAILYACPIVMREGVEVSLAAFVQTLTGDTAETYARTQEQAHALVQQAKQDYFNQVNEAWTRPSQTIHRWKHERHGITECVDLSPIADGQLWLFVDTSFYKKHLANGGLVLKISNGEVLTADGRNLANIVASERHDFEAVKVKPSVSGVVDLRYRNLIVTVKQKRRAEDVLNTESKYLEQEFATPKNKTPWDYVDLSKSVQATESLWQCLGWVTDDERHQALATLQTEKPDDHIFIINYVNGSRKGLKYSLVDRSRALSIRRWLKRRLEK